MQPRRALLSLLLASACMGYNADKRSALSLYAAVSRIASGEQAILWIVVGEGCRTCRICLSAFSGNDAGSGQGRFLNPHRDQEEPRPRLALPASAGTGEHPIIYLAPRDPGIQTISAAAWPGEGPCPDMAAPQATALLTFDIDASSPPASGTGTNVTAGSSDAAVDL